MDPHVYRIQSQNINCAELRQNLAVENHTGGLVFFEGIVRKQNHGLTVRYLDYECYDVLAIKEMQRIAKEAEERFQLASTGQIHRVGRLNVGDVAVLVYAMAEHRQEAFAGCRYLIDSIKTRVPIWKKEVYEDNSSTWVRCHEHINHVEHR